ncbi:hypothetical protein HC766_08355 [Candidatus Gracilibacteria bacterium]|nr:hypothetical protein [Candidatus Gracilibacteria bacterium]
MYGQPKGANNSPACRCNICRQTAVMVSVPAEVTCVAFGISAGVSNQLAIASGTGLLFVSCCQ